MLKKRVEHSISAYAMILLKKFVIVIFGIFFNEKMLSFCFDKIFSYEQRFLFLEIISDNILSIPSHIS